MNLSNKIIVITGGAKGLGLAMTNILVGKGSKVIVINTDEQALKKVSDELGVASIKADVTNEQELKKATENILNQFGHIDIWINNAGIWMPPIPIEEIDLDKAHRLFEVNIFGYINGMRSVLPSMKEKKTGTIVNIISTTAFDGMTGSSGSIYVSSKYALRGLTNSIRQECEPFNIKVIGIYPGGIKTGLFNEAIPAHIDQFMSADDVASKIIDNLEQENPEIQLVLKRPGQQLSNELK